MGFKRSAVQIRPARGEEEVVSGPQAAIRSRFRNGLFSPALSNTLERMTRVALVVGIALLAFRVVSAQDTPTATPTPGPQGATPTNPAPEAISPTPAPQPTPPQLLPESGQLPAAPSPTPPLRNAPRQPYDLIPEGVRPAPSPALQNRPSAAQRLADTVRFRQLRTIAQNDPHALTLWLTAQKAPTIESRREYTRAYYQFLGARMRALEPRLKAQIDAYEKAGVASATQVNIRPTIPLRDLHRKAEAN